MGFYCGQQKGRAEWRGENVFGYAPGYHPVPSALGPDGMRTGYINQGIVENMRLQCAEALTACQLPDHVRRRAVAGLVLAFSLSEL